MSVPSRDARVHDKPTPDDLAGTPACNEEDHSISPDVKARGRGKSTCTIPPTQPLPSSPTADDLAGMPVSVEGSEDLTVRPRKPNRR
jgi:hypothetical protein